MKKSFWLNPPRPTHPKALHRTPFERLSVTRRSFNGGFMVWRSIGLFRYGLLVGEQAMLEPPEGFGL